MARVRGGDEIIAANRMKRSLHGYEVMARPKWRPIKPSSCKREVVDVTTAELLNRAGRLSLDFGTTNAPASVLEAFKALPPGASREAGVFNAYLKHQNRRMCGEYALGKDMAEFKAEEWNGAL